MTGDGWTRRTFLSTAGLSGVAALTPELVSRAYASGRQRQTFLHASVLSGQDGSIHSFRIEGDACRKVGVIASVQPKALAAHPSLPVIFAANNCAEYQYLPRSTVEAFAVDLQTGSLQPLARYPLSLSAIQPSSLAVSPGGKTLVVASFAGGAWNAFGLDEHGLPVAAPAILKETGRGAHPVEQTSSHPLHISWADANTVISSDYGADRLSLLHVADGSFSVKHRHAFPPGAGPAYAALHKPSGLVIAGSGLEPALTSFRLVQGASPRVVPLHSVSLERRSKALAVNETLPVAYSLSSSEAGEAMLTSWTLQPDSGQIHLQKKIALSCRGANSVAIDQSSSTLWIAADDGVYRVSLHPRSGSPQSIHRVAELQNAHSLLLQEI